MQPFKYKWYYLLQLLKVLIFIPIYLPLQLHITNTPTGVEKMEVISVLGNVVESVENPTSSIELGQELSTETYFIYLYSTDGVQVEKVMKVN